MALTMNDAETKEQVLPTTVERKEVAQRINNQPMSKKQWSLAYKYYRKKERQHLREAQIKIGKTARKRIEEQWNILQDEERRKYLQMADECVKPKKVRALHLMLQTIYGHFYVADVTKFDWITLEDPPIQDNAYDCGMFVIKHMQGIPLANGVQKFDSLERLRLLVDLVRDSNNASWREISVKIEKYKQRNNLILE